MLQPVIKRKKKMRTIFNQYINSTCTVVHVVTEGANQFHGILFKEYARNVIYVNMLFQTQSLKRRQNCSLSCVLCDTRFRSL